jgi:hypothetical protein
VEGLELFLQVPKGESFPRKRERERERQRDRDRESRLKRSTLAKLLWGALLEDGLHWSDEQSQALPRQSPPGWHNLYQPQVKKCPFVVTR